MKAAVSLDLEERCQDDDIQKIGMFLDPRFKKIPYLTEVERTDIWLQARDELVAITKDDQDRQESHEGSQSSHNCHAGNPETSSPQLAKLLGDILEIAGHGEVQTEEEIAEAMI